MLKYGEINQQHTIRLIINILGDKKIKIIFVATKTEDKADKKQPELTKETTLLMVLLKNI